MSNEKFFVVLLTWMLLQLAVIALVSKNSDAKVECYKAAQVNQNIKCEY